MVVVQRWLCSGDGYGSWVVVWWSNGCGPTRWFDFMGLGLWVWVHGFGFVGLGSWVWVRGSSTWSAWIIKLTDVDRRLDRCG